MKTATVSQAAGSAYAEVGGTKVLCAVYGPRQLAATEAEFSTNGKLRCEYKVSRIDASTYSVHFSLRKRHLLAQPIDEGIG